MEVSTVNHQRKIPVSDKMAHRWVVLLTKAKQHFQGNFSWNGVQGRSCTNISSINAASSPLPSLVSLHSPSCESREPHLGNWSTPHQGKTSGLVWISLLTQFHFTTAQIFLLGLDREWDEQPRAERKHYSFPGTRASFSTGTWRGRWQGAGLTLTLLHPFSKAEGHFLWLSLYFWSPWHCRKELLAPREEQDRRLGRIGLGIKPSLW